MRPNISNCHALPGTLIVFEGPDGSGKTTQIQALKKMLQKEWKKVTISSWKSAPILGEFMKTNESLKKGDERILPETSLFFQAWDLAYRLEREVIPALKKNHIVILDRSMQTLIVRGLMLGMSEDQLRKGLIWWRNSIYKELFDKAITIHIQIGLEESLKRLQKRWLSADIWAKKKWKNPEGTLLALDFINSLIYSPEGKKMTRNDKKAIIRKTQSSIIETYNKVFSKDTGMTYITLNGENSITEVETALRKQLIDQIL